MQLAAVSIIAILDFRSEFQLAWVDLLVKCVRVGKLVRQANKFFTEVDIVLLPDNKFKGSIAENIPLSNVQLVLDNVVVTFCQITAPI